ncbi:MAG: hypothetical protein AABM33_17830 [Pseudomonadota bacterium]
MNLRSFIADQTGEDVAFIVLNVTTKLGPFTATLGVGKIENGELFLSPVAQACLERMAKLTERTKDKETVHFVEVASKNKLRDKVRNAFLRATRHDQIFFVCRDDKIYDQVFEELHIQNHDATSDSSH